MSQLQLMDLPTAPASVRERELEVGRLVLRAASSRVPFVVRRAASAVDALAASAARRALRNAVAAVAESDAGTLSHALASYGAVLESHDLPEAAGEVYGALMTQCPGAAAYTLHTARAARRAGRREAALLLYRQAGRECGSDAHMLMLVRIGEALVSADPVRELSAVARDARRAGDRDALAIAREERAACRASAQRSDAALRDLAAAAARYRDPVDRLRVLHRMSELLTSRGDVLGAREALLAALDHAAPAQRGYTVQRMRVVARALGDELELRRTRGQAAAGPVSLGPLSSRRPPATRSVARRLRRWRSALRHASPRH
jgi:hypothetical protein